MKLAEVLSPSQHKDLLQLQQDAIDLLPASWNVDIVKDKANGGIGYTLEIDTGILKAPWRVTAFRNSSDEIELEYRNPTLEKAKAIIIKKLPLPAHDPNESDHDIRDHIQSTWFCNFEVLNFRDILRDQGMVYADVKSKGWRQKGLEEMCKMAIHYYDGDHFQMIPDSNQVTETLELMNRIEPV
jgi:hypothetical protein